MKPSWRSTKPSGRSVGRFGASLASGLLVPALLTWLYLGSLLPVMGDAPFGSLSDRFARVVRDYPVPVGALFFLIVGALASYVRRELVPPAGQDRGKGSLVLVTAVVSAALAALLLRASLFQSYRVVSASMLPTLGVGDEIVVDKRAYGLRLPGSSHRFGPSTPARGDVVVFGKTVGGQREELVKRVIGLPGDRITMDGGRAIINGWKVPTCDAGRYFYLPRGGGRAVDGRLAVEFLDDRAYLVAFTPLAPPFEAYVVRPGELFVLGDNRNESNDSRLWNEGRGGGVPFPDVVGRSSRKLLSLTRAGRVDFSAFLAPLGTAVTLEGVDVSPLEANVRSCLAKRPAETRPPAPR